MKNMPPDRQAYMKGRMKSATEKNYTLEFDSNSSYFQEEDVLRAIHYCVEFRLVMFRS